MKKSIEILTECLNLPGISLKTDIITVIIDGSSILIKVGKEANHHPYWVHSIHLAICDTLYHKYKMQPETSFNNCILSYGNKDFENDSGIP